MSEEELRRAYPTTRILVESDRILTPTFDDAELFFTGAQIELMRNLLGYANRQNTYVATYGPGYYVMPDATDFDDILAIVADLEETLMGNRNVVLGYYDRFFALNNYSKSGDGDYLMTLLEVSAGYVYVVETLVSYSSDTPVKHAHQLCSSTACMTFYEETQAQAGDLVYSGCVRYTLKEGDKLKIQFTGCLDGDAIGARAWGYKMVVP